PTWRKKIRNPGMILKPTWSNMIQQGQHFGV
ncbi:MAG: hypothetical protein ACI8U0_002084, partial [Flavobacteriales bacterium]